MCEKKISEATPAPPPVRTPAEIKEMLENNMWGHENATKSLAPSPYNNYKRVTTTGVI